MLLGLLVMAVWQAAMSYIFSSILPAVNKLSHALEGPKEIDDGYVSRIAYGTPANIKDHPYFADLEWCGGTIISDQWVLTAAHCVGPFPKPHTKLNYVSVGSDNNKNRKLVKIEEIIVHPAYVNYMLLNDIALIKLADTLEFNDKIQPIHLPHEYEAFKFGSSSVFVGKGINETKKQTEHLMKMEVSIYPTEYCSRKNNLKPYNWFFDTVMYFLNDTQLCAVRSGGVPGAGPGDSGSPLVQDNTLVGLASYGNGKSDTLFLTNVAYYVPWINFVTEGNVDYQDWSCEESEEFFSEESSEESEESSSEETEESAAEETEESAAEETKESSPKETEESSPKESKELSSKASDERLLEEGKQSKGIPLPYYNKEDKSQPSVKQMELTTEKGLNLPKRGKKPVDTHYNMSVL